MSKFILPDDVFRPEGISDAEAFSSLQEQSAEARAKRTDLIGLVALEEHARGGNEWRERVQNRLTLDGSDPIGLKVISDASKIFRLFRLGGEEGYGWTRDQMAKIQPGRLRVFAQNYTWAIKNRDAVEDMLRSGVNEGEMRDRIRRAKLTGNLDTEGDEQKEEWMSFHFRVPPSLGRLLQGVVDGARAKAEQTDGMEFSSRRPQALGEVLALIAAEWFHGEEQFTRGGELVTVPNSEWMSPEVLAAIAQDGAEDEEDGDAFAQAAD